MGEQTTGIFGSRRGRKAAPRGKVLRIGILQGGKICEERLIRAGQSVTVGPSSRNTFVLPTPDLPRQYRLFIARGPEYVLAYDASMRGKVFLNNEVVPLQQLAGTVARRHGDAYWLSLSERNRGKVRIGEVTILFQFVDAPPEPRRTPENYSPISASQVDWVFWSFFLLSLILNAAAYVYIQSQPPPSKVSIDDIPPRMAEIWFTQEPEEETADEALADDGEEPVADEPDEPDQDAAAEDGEAGPGDAADEEPLSYEERRQQMEEKFSQTGLVAVLGTTGQTSSEDAVHDLLVDDDRLAQDLDGALDRSETFRVATLDRDPDLRDGFDRDQDGLATVDDRSTSGGGDSGEGRKDQKQVEAMVDLSDPQLDPGVDRGSVTGVFSSKSGQVKACYERFLTGDPELAGKIALVIVVATDGNVTSVWADQNTTDHQPLEQCITRRISHWTFPATGDEYEIAYTFNLYPG